MHYNLYPFIAKLSSSLHFYTYFCIPHCSSKNFLFKTKWAFTFCPNIWNYAWKRHLHHFKLLETIQLAMHIALFAIIIIVRLYFSETKKKVHSISNKVIPVITQVTLFTIPCISRLLIPFPPFSTTSRVSSCSSFHQTAI